MTIYVWKFGKKSKSTKIPNDSDATTITNAKIYNNVDVINPVVEVAKSSYNDGYNYLKMTLLGKDRYYFVTNVVQENESEVLIYLHEDYMATFRDAIKTHGIGWYVERSSIFSWYSGDSQILYDEGRITTTKERELLESFKIMADWYSTNSNDGVFILGLRCGVDINTLELIEYNCDNLTNWGDSSTKYGPIPFVIGVRGTTQYVMVTHTDMVEFAYEVAQRCITSQKGTEIINQQTWSNFTGCIESIRYVPVHCVKDTGIKYTIGDYSFYRITCPLFIADYSIFPDNKLPLPCLSPVDFTATMTITDAMIQKYTDGLYPSIFDETIKIPVRDDAIITSSGNTKILEYMNKSPFTKYYMWIPYVGVIDINSDLISNATYDSQTDKWIYQIDMIVDVDFVGGVLKFEIRDTLTNVTLKRETISIGIDIGSPKFESDAYKGVANAILGIGGAFVGLGLAGAVGGVAGAVGTSAVNQARGVINEYSGVKQYDLSSQKMVNPYQNEIDRAQETIDSYTQAQNKQRVTRASSIVGATLGGIGSVMNNLGGGSFTSGQPVQGTFVDNLFGGNFQLYRDILNVLPEDVFHVGRPIMKTMLFNGTNYADGQYVKCRNSLVTFVCLDSEAKAIEDIMDSGFYLE